MNIKLAKEGTFSTRAASGKERKSEEVGAIHSPLTKIMKDLLLY